MNIQPQKTISLTVHTEAGLGVPRTFTQRVIKIGKLSTSQLRLDDESVARMHAVIEVSGDNIKVIDLGSAGGTIVNGDKVEHSAQLHDGDTLCFGEVLVDVEISANPGAEQIHPLLAAPRKVLQDAGKETDIGGTTEPPPEKPSSLIEAARKIAQEAVDNLTITDVLAAQNARIEELEASLAENKARRTQENKIWEELLERTQDVAAEWRDVAYARMRPRKNRGPIPLLEWEEETS